MKNNSSAYISIIRISAFFHRHIVAYMYVATALTLLYVNLGLMYRVRHRAYRYHYEQFFV